MTHAVEISDNLSDIVYNRWTNLGRSLHPYEMDLYSSPNVLFESRDNSTGWMGRPPILDNVMGVANAETACINKDGFHASVDVHQFAPKDISVKIVGDSVVVEAKHDERRDQHGHVSRQLIRRYDLPKGFHPDHVVPELSSDGVLTIRATPEHKIVNGERILPLRHTGPARLYVKEKKFDNYVD